MEKKEKINRERKEDIREESREEKKIDRGETKKEKEKKDEAKEKREIVKKDKAIVKGKDLRISTKHSIAICDMIRGKRIEEAIKDLEEVIAKRKAIKMKGEIPHRKGMGIERGRYPVKASRIFIKLLKSLNANASVNNLGEPYICIAKADKASRPYRRFGSKRMKRTNVYLEAREMKEDKKN